MLLGVSASLVKPPNQTLPCVEGKAYSNFQGDLLGLGRERQNSGRVLPVIRVVLQQEVGELTGIV